MKKDNLRILGIESSCDETAASVVESGRLVHSSVIASQVDLHAQYGGVYPELASREHVKAIYAVTNEALQQAHMQIRDLDAIAVTRGPGLAGSLVVGVNFAKGLAVGSNLPLYPISHLEGHIYAAWCSPADTKPGPEPKFPLVALLVSGGHTELLLMTGHLQYQLLGSTVDDAAGEAFDKVARLLDLAYPVLKFLLFTPLAHQVKLVATPEILFFKFNPPPFFRWGVPPPLIVAGIQLEHLVRDICHRSG